MELNDFVVLFASQFDDTDPAEITAQTSFHNLDEWSSLLALSVTAFVSEEMGKNVTLPEMRSCDTVEDLYNLVQSK